MENIFNEVDLSNFEKMEGVTADEIEFMKNNSNRPKNEILCWCAEKGYLKSIHFLIENGANIHHNADLPLALAAESGHLEVVKYLVESGADIRSRNDLPLRWSSGYGHFEVVKYLVDNGANIHTDGDGALLWAIFYCEFEVVRHLLERGSNISVLSDQGVLELIKKNIVVGGTGSKIMEHAWEELVQPVKDEKKKVLDQIITETMKFLLKPDSIRVKALEHQFTYKDYKEEYRYMD